MRDPDLEDRVEEELGRWADRVSVHVTAPDVEQIHRRAEARTVRGIAVTFAATAVAGVLLGAAVIGVGGIGMRDDRPAGRLAARPLAIPAQPSPAAPAAGAGGPSPAASTPVRRPPLTLQLAFRSGARDARGCRTVWRVERTLPAPTPRSVVRAVLAGPTPAERGRGMGSVYGRRARPTPATISVDRARKIVTVDLESLASVGISPAACRGREIRGPVADALKQYDPRWGVRFTVRGDPEAVPR